MTISWYSIAISLQSGGGAIFNGYFSVDDTTNLVTAFYETINGSTDFNNSILGPNPFPPPLDFYTADNTFILGFFGGGGTNITSTTLQTEYNSDIPYYNIYGNDAIDENVLWQGDNLTNSIIIIPISDPSCFNEGTKILCLNKNLEEEYILIENLRKGDLVKSYKHGYRKIDLIGKNPMINNPEKFNECMYKMTKTYDNGLIEDLIVTGGHAILVDDLRNYKEENDKLLGSVQIIDDKYLLLSAVSKDFIKLENTNLYTYYHFILENNGNDDERFGVWANGVITETPSKNQFTNHKYTLL
jgi:hypothetical protein